MKFIELSKTIDYDCPYCGEINQTIVDVPTVCPDLVEDCRVCCQPILIGVDVDETGEVAAFSAVRENG